MDIYYLKVNTQKESGKNFLALYGITEKDLFDRRYRVEHSICVTVYEDRHTFYITAPWGYGDRLVSRIMENSNEDLSEVLFGWNINETYHVNGLGSMEEREDIDGKKWLEWTQINIGTIYNKD